MTNWVARRFDNTDIAGAWLMCTATGRATTIGLRDCARNNAC